MKKEGTIVTLLMMSVVLLLSGCFTMNANLVDSGIDAEMTNSKEMEIVGHFVEHRTVSHFLLGSVGSGNGVLEKVIEDVMSENPEATGVANVEMKHSNTFATGFLGILTMGIYSPTRLTVEGDLVK